MAHTLGALTPWLHREFLSQRNAYGDRLPTTPVEEGKRVQLIRATGMTEANGETLVWAEMNDGELWIDCCIPLSLVEQYNRRSLMVPGDVPHSKTARTFAASSSSKCIFRLLSWRFVIASPLIPSHGQHSPRKSSTLATPSTATPRTQAPRVCLRIYSFKHYGIGEGTMQADFKPFRSFTPDVTRVRGDGKEDAARQEREKRDKERVAWVRRLEDRVRGTSEEQARGDVSAVAEEQVAFMDDLPRPSTTTSAPRKTTQLSPVTVIPPPPALPPAHTARPGWPTDKNAPLPRIDFGEVEALLNRYKRKQAVQHDGPIAKDKGKGKAKAVEPEPTHVHSAAHTLPGDPTGDATGDWTSAVALLTRKRPRASSASMSAAPPPLAPSAAAPADPPPASPRRPAAPLSASPSRRRRDAAQLAAARSPVGRPQQLSASPRSKKDDATARREKRLVEMEVDTVKEKGAMDEDFEEDVRYEGTSTMKLLTCIFEQQHHARRVRGLAGTDLLDEGCAWLASRWSFAPRYAAYPSAGISMTPHAGRRSSGRPRALVQYRSLDKRSERIGSSDSNSETSDWDDDTDDPSAHLPPPATNPFSPLLLLVGVLIVAIAGGAFVLFLYKRDQSAASDVSASPATLTQVATVPVSTVAVTTMLSQADSLSATSPSPASPSTTTPSASSSASASSPATPSSSSVDHSKLKALGISTFLGNLTGAIASWYHTDSTTDSTNDDDSVPGFAPSLKTMLSSFNGDATAAKKGFCGLKATVYSPKTGKQVSMIIADALDDKWVRTPNSIDVIYGSVRPQL
ncbi:hypothetical protein AAT19DRAFT_15062 [Rhodotorula toruloides]|uniref:Uncharacterized protein n=2 Tax=Rhodotorula toruloides TaxID=5286 RepID=A0A2T0A9R8_RHOTO|nr:hypothetical protein AAT19DRAFT_15062 [Rhodotorula toruloides]